MNLNKIKEVVQPIANLAGISVYVDIEATPVIRELPEANFVNPVLIDGISIELRPRVLCSYASESSAAMLLRVKGFVGIYLTNYHSSGKVFIDLVDLEKLIPERELRLLRFKSINSLDKMIKPALVKSFIQDGTRMDEYKWED